jgi:hypothetical protein
MAIPTERSSFHAENKFLRKQGYTGGAEFQEVNVLHPLPYRDRRERWKRLQMPIERSIPTPENEKVTQKIQPSPSAAVFDGILAIISQGTMPRMPDWYRRIIRKHKAWESREKLKAEGKQKEKKEPSPKNSDNVHVVSKLSTETTLSTLWNPSEEISITAAVGQVLHRALIKTSKSSLKKVLCSSKSVCTFLPVVPNLPLLLPHLSGSSADKVIKDTLSFRLIQDTWMSKSDGYLPEIRLEFVVSSLGEKTQSAEFSRMYAILSEHKALAMLPTHAADLCFTKRTTILMDPQGIAANKKIKAFIEHTQENIVGRGALRAPQQITIPLPTWTVEKIAPLGNDKASSASEAKKHDDQSLVMGDYVFVGVEHRETLCFEYDGLDLWYNSVEAGKMGGHYGELTLMKSEHVPKETFVTKAFNLVGLVDQAVHGKLGAGADQIKMEKIPEKKPPKYWVKPERIVYKGNDAGKKTATSSG